MLTERLRTLREEKRLTQKQIAKFLNIQQGTYSDYERGRRNIPLESLIKLANFYHVSLDYLVGRTDEK